MNSGPEIGVASTKAFTSMLMGLFYLSLNLAEKRKTLLKKDLSEKISIFRQIPAFIQSILSQEEQIKKVAQQFYPINSCLFLGRGQSFPIALEGALKLKEISYIHAEGYAGGELKHGPLALIDENMPVIALAPESEIAEKLISNLEEVKARGGTLYVCADPSVNMDVKSGKLIHMPECDFFMTPIVYNIPLQILSYEVALLRGTDIDQPRNLAKSVTVE